MWNSLSSFDSNGNFPSNGSVDNAAVPSDSLWPDVYRPPKGAANSAAQFTSSYNSDQCYPDFQSLLGHAEYHAVSTAAKPYSQHPIPHIEFLEPLWFTEDAARADCSSSSIMSQINELLSQSDQSNDRELSTEDLMRAAAFHFIQTSSPRCAEIPPLLRQPFGLLISGLTVDEVKDVQLANTLLAAAEKVSHRHYARATTLLQQCYSFSSNTGNPVERVVHYFSHALQERIRRESGKREGIDLTASNFIKEMLAHHPVHLVAHYALPFSQIMQFTSIQAILDEVANARRIHLIDLSIKHGLQWTILMRALATRTTCHVQSLKISAVESSWEATGDTGSRLSSFAESLHLPFKFTTVVVPDLKDLREDAFEVDEGDVVGVYSGQVMNNLIATPERLDNLMGIIRKLKPSVMTVFDVEAKHNSPSFINRFTEALFYFSTLFDYLDGTMERDDSNRMVLEGIYYTQAIRSIVAAEGKEREVRHVGVDVWRRYFLRFGLVEAELSEWSLYHACEFLKQLKNGESCTLEKNGESLLIGWKGTPVNFVSAWKFQKGEGKMLHV